jgi:hypothetical protein
MYPLIVHFSTAHSQESWPLKSLFIKFYSRIHIENIRESAISSPKKIIHHPFP